MTSRHIRAAKAASKHYYALTDCDRDQRRLDPYAPDQMLRSFHELKSPSWVIEPLDRCIVSLCRYYYPDRDRSIFVSLSSEGDVGFIGKEEGFYEKIPGAGLRADDALGYGYMQRIRQVGTDLFACGYSGQVYRRVAPDTWHHIDDGILLPVTSKDVFAPSDVNGPDADHLYLVANRGQVFFRDASRKNATWSRIGVPTDEWLNAVHVENPDTVWICGRNGTLLKGNAKTGFSDLSSIQDNQTFLSIASFEGKIYLGHAEGVSVYDGYSIQSVSTGLKPNLRGSHLVDAVDGVLWSFGYDDIARFDGVQWIRYPTDRP